MLRATGELHGVFRTQDGEPILHARITFTSEDEQQEDVASTTVQVGQGELSATSEDRRDHHSIVFGGHTTGTDGTFRFSGARPGRVLVEATHDGLLMGTGTYHRAKAYANVVGGGSTFVELIAERADQALEVRLLLDGDLQHGTLCSVNEAKSRQWSGGFAVGPIDDGGRVHLRVPQRETYDVVISMPNGSNAQVRMADRFSLFSRNLTTTRAPEVLEDGSLRIEVVVPSGRADGLVLSEDGEPMVGEELTLRRLRPAASPSSDGWSIRGVFRLDAQGRFRLEHLPGGRYELAQHLDQKTLVATFELAEGQHAADLLLRLEDEQR